MAQDYFRALRDVALVVNSTLEPRAVLQKITEETAKTMECKASTIRLLDRTGRFLLPSAAWGLSPTYMRKGPVEVKKSGLDSKVLAGNIVHLRNAPADNTLFQYPDSARAEGLVSVLSAPLVANGTPIGLIRVYSSEECDFTPEEQNFLQAVAAISAVAIENARLHDELRNNYDLLSKQTYQMFEE